MSKTRDEMAQEVRKASEVVVAKHGDLQKTMDKAFSKIGELAKKVIVEVLIDEFSKLQAATPYDTGRAQAGWLISGEGSAIAFYPKEGAGGGFKAQNPDMGSLMKSDLIYVINNVEYVLYLEAGWSKRQPGGFVASFLSNCKRRIAQECAAMSRMS
jgi:hypothetical protein